MNNIIRIEEVLRKEFKTSRIEERSILGSTSISLYLANNENELFNNYWINDMLKFTLWIDNDNNKTIYRQTDCYYFVKPTKNLYLCYETKKLRNISKTDNLDRFLKALEKQLKKLKTSIIEDYKNNLIENANHKKSIENNLL